MVKEDIKNEDITYRRATVADTDVLTEFRVRYLYETFGPGDENEAGALKNSLRYYFSRTVEAGDFVAWLAESGGEVVATSGMVVWRMPGGYTSISGRTGYILNMYTVPEARGLGIASRLFDELLNEARELGLKYLHLHTTEDGINVYRKAGFAETKLPELEMELE